MLVRRLPLVVHCEVPGVQIPTIRAQTQTKEALPEGYSSFHLPSLAMMSLKVVEGRMTSVTFASSGL